MSTPQPSPPNFPLSGCSYTSFSNFSWREISCNLSDPGPHIPWNPTAYCLIAVLHALGIWIALDIIARTVARFTRRNTLYFWSIITVAFGTICNALAFDLRIFVFSATNNAFALLFTAAQISLKTGTGLILYSRLNIIQQNQRLLKGVLCMIIILAIIGHTPVVIKMIAAFAGNWDVVNSIYYAANYLELIFAIQDTILSILYVYFFWRYANDVPPATKSRMKKDIWIALSGLVIAHSFLVASDFTLSILIYVRFYLARMLFMPFACAIKLYLEFLVLNNLVEFSKKRQQQLGRQSVGNSLFGSPQQQGVRQHEAEEVCEGSPSDEVWGENVAAMSSKKDVEAYGGVEDVPFHRPHELIEISNYQSLRAVDAKLCCGDTKLS